jgi:ABC-type transport system involved in multi-copper enzyme maturation permease subunit
MLSELKAEFKKVFSIRSTYIILALMLALVIFFGFYVGGWHADKLSLIDHGWLFKVSQQAISFLSIFPALIGLLLLTHEFRYNLSAYSLTLSNNRSKVLAAKIIVISLIAVFATAIIGSLSPLLADWGIHAHHLTFVHQYFSVGSIAWRGLVFGWGYAMAGLVIATLIRNQIGAIVVLFIVPNTVEGLLSLLLKSNSVYMPFSALHTMLGVGQNIQKASITPLSAMFVFLGYLIVSWIVAWILFLRRDAI